MNDLFIDLIVNWFKLNVKNLKGFTVIILLSIPIAFLVNFQFINSSLISTHFGSSATENVIRNIAIEQNKIIKPIELYLKDEIEKKWQNTQVTHEYTLGLKYELNGINREAFVSFFSGGFNKLNIVPYRGSLDEIDFPIQGARNVAAISYKYWRNKLDSKKIIGEQLIINGIAITVVAILPQSFVSFRNNVETEIVIPFNQLANIDGLNSITPNMFSYVIGAEKVVQSIRENINNYLHNEGLILDGDSIQLNDAIGFDTTEFIQIKERLSILTSVFSLLLVFSFFSFITYYIGECVEKNKEFQVRKLCGASSKQVNIQFIIETLLISITLIIFCSITIPLTHVVMAHLFFGEVTHFLKVNLLVIGQLLSSILILMFTLIAVCTVIQKKVITTSIGRGQNATLGEKIQSYFLVATLLSLTCISIFFSQILIKEQLDLYLVEDGYAYENRYIVTFDFPKSIDIEYINNEPAKMLIQQLVLQEGIDNAALTFVPPLSNRTSYSRWYTANGMSIGNDSQSLIRSDNVSPDFFNTIGANFFKGNTLNWDNHELIVVNKVLYDNFLNTPNGESSVLLKVLSSGNGTEDRLPYKVIGVIDNILIDGADTQPTPTVYSSTLVMTGAESIIIKTALSLTDLQKVLDETFESVNVVLKSYSISSLDKLKQLEDRPRLMVLFVTLTACLIIIMSSVIFCLNIINQFIHRNAREYAIRTALGASFFQIVRYELFIFLSVFSILWVVLLFMLTKFEGAMNNLLISRVDLFQVELLLITMFCCSTFLIALTFKLKKTYKKSWNYLT
jgi:hypothetical protein